AWVQAPAGQGRDAREQLRRECIQALGQRAALTDAELPYLLDIFCDLYRRWDIHEMQPWVAPFGQNALALLLGRLRAATETDRWGILQALAALGTTTPLGPAVPDLTPLLDDADQHTLALALSALGFAGDDARPLVSRVVAYLTHE